MRGLLQSWDSLSMEERRECVQLLEDDPDSVSSLLTFAGDADWQVGATWLLKQAVDKGHVDGHDLRKLYSRLDDIVEWEAMLHVLQLMHAIPLEEDDLDLIERFLARCSVDQNTFVRAWSYSGWYEVAMAFPSWRPRVDVMLQQGLADEKASVRARIRNLLKRG